MKFSVISLPVVLSLGLFAVGQNSRTVPAGIRHAQQLQAENERGFPADGVVQSSANPATLQREADELANLAASVPPNVQNVNKGLLAKDLIQKLKDIEKLSKRLRSELKH